MNGLRGTRLDCVVRGGCFALLCGFALASAKGRAEVDMSGIEGEQLDNALAFMDIDDLACDAPQVAVNGAFDEARTQIRRSMEAFGYYAVTIEARLMQSADCWTASFSITPGPRVALREVTVEILGEASGSPDFSAAVAGSRLARGRPLLHGSYEALKSRLRTLARERGYVEAAFTESRIDVYPDERAAVVVVRFDSGPRYRFGEVDIDQSVLDQDLVAAYLGFREGDPYDSRLISEFQIALRDSGYFESVNVTPGVPDPEAKAVPLSVSLVGTPRKLLSYGVGFSTDTGPRLKFGRTIRRYNERGHQLGLDAQLSPVVTEISSNYRLPYGDPRFEWISFDAGAKRERTETAESKSLEVGARRVINRDNGWTRTQILSLLVEDFKVGSELGQARLLIPAIEWSRLRADNSLRPERGSRLAFEARGAAEDLVSDTSFAQIVVAGKWIWSTNANGRVLVRSRMGATWEDEFRALPPSVRFFAGGDNSVRGYDFETLGPVNEAGEVIGGANLFTASVEYEHDVRPRWSVAVFFDTGNAFDNTDVELMSGAGLGARWQSPLGPVRVDLAMPLDGPDRSVRLHISLGPDL